MRYKVIGIHEGRIVIRTGKDLDNIVYYFIKDCGVKPKWIFTISEFLSGENRAYNVLRKLKEQGELKEVIE